jgi:hypothetical protein
MYESADKTPVLVGSESIILDDYVGLSELEKEKFWSVYYDENQRPIITAESNADIHIYNVSGSLLHSGFVRSGANMFPLFSPGIYLITSSETSTALKLIVR